MFSPRRVVCAGAKTMGADAARSAAQQGTEGASLTAAWHSLFKGVSLVINYDFPQTTNQDELLIARKPIATRAAAAADAVSGGGMS